MTAKPTYEELEERIRQLGKEAVELKKREERLLRSRKQYRQLLENLDEILYTLDLNARVTYISPNCRRVTGYSRKEVVGRPYTDFVHPEERAVRAEQFQKVLSGKPVGTETRFLTRDKGYIWAMTRVRPVREQGRTVGAQGVLVDITEQKEAEKRLRQSEERYRLLVETSSDIIWTFDLSSMTFTYVSKSVERILGYSQDEATGDALEDTFLPETRKKVMAAFDRVASGKSESDRLLVEAEHLRKDGGAVWVEINAVLHRDGQGRPVFFTGVSRDIRDRKKAEEALRKSEEKYRSILESMEEGYFEMDLAGNVTFFNDAAARILGYSRHELAGMSNRQYMDEKTAKKAFEVYNRVYRTGKPATLEWELLKKDGSSCFVENSVSLLRDENGQPVGFRGIARDVSERKKAEEEKEMLQSQLRRVQQMEAIGTLAGGIAHDFNNILSSVIGYTELAMDEVESGSLVQKNLSQVLAAGNRAKALVKQILTLARGEEQELMPMQVAPLVKETLKMLRSTIPTSIEVRQQISEEPLIVHADPTQIHQVIVNLATNARLAMVDESGVLEVRVEKVAFDESISRKYPGMGPGNYVRIAVSDTGVGIPEQYLDKIFEPYFTTRKKETGTGLGLSIAHGIVKAHQGHITVYSEPGRGSTFHVYLPLAEMVRPASAALEDGALPRGTECVLLVDDEQPIVEIQKLMLERLGYAVVARTSSVEALEAFRANPAKFDLLITDMTMPNMTGDQLAAAARRIRPDLPVILCTGFSQKLNGLPQDLGIDSILMKPVDKTQIAQTVRAVLDKSREA